MVGRTMKWWWGYGFKRPSKRWLSKEVQRLRWQVALLEAGHDPAEAKT